MPPRVRYHHRVASVRPPARVRTAAWPLGHGGLLSPAVRRGGVLAVLYVRIKDEASGHIFIVMQKRLVQAPPRPRRLALGTPASTIPPSPP